MRPFSLRLVAFATFSIALLLSFAGCGPDTSDVLGEAYVAPASLNVRGELNQKNSNVALLRHGERVSIIEVRRRFVKIRTQNGLEGWVDALQLLSPEQMDEIHRDTERALAMPSEGAAGVYEALNIHIEPNRQSPAFARIPEGASVMVLAHRVEPKAGVAPKVPNFIAERPQTPARKPRKEKSSRVRLPAPPPPPKPPANWLALSGHPNRDSETARRDQEATEKHGADLKKPVILEDWTLVRTKDNQCGWVLSRNLVMSIPDDVAQYAEGKRITSYFDLGTVHDEVKGVRHNWLWTTSAALEPFDFDSWRVFLWNRRHHRFETSVRKRNVEGYFPVHVDPPDANAFGRTFEIITKDDDGKFRRRTYVFDGTRVQLTATADYNPAAPANEKKAGALDTDKLQAKMPREGWFRRQWNALKHTFSGH